MIGATAKKIILGALFLIALGASIPQQAYTAGSDEGLLNKLLAPGKLTEGHKDMEGDCLSCHVAGKGIPDAKCLTCHAQIKASVSKKKGFHGLQTKTCIQCHTDHKGREFDSTKVDTKTFDHKLTGYPLEGKHAELKCSECHTEKRAKEKKSIRPEDPEFFGLRTSCKTCHKKDDPHFFKGSWAQEDCSKCHAMQKWSVDVKFDHTRDAHFKLEGKHADLKCATCHVPKQGESNYKWPDLKARQCLSCHQDQHKGKFGSHFSGGKCTTCHTQSHWKIEKFDHALTGYALKGAHATLECASCHKQTPGGPHRELKDFKFTGLGKDCLSCHKDFHHYGSTVSERLGPLNRCQTCHGETHWKPAKNFNHSTDTRFVIAGKHVGLDCNQCHIPAHIPAKKDAPTGLKVYHWDKLKQKTCETCHASPHLKTFSPKLLEKKCTDCHTDEGWKFDKKGKSSFDHDSATRFKLTGRHSALSCNSCHLVNGKQVFKFENAETGFCVSCHKNQHIGQFSEKFARNTCTDCHTTKTFEKIIGFNHDATRFKLTGQHMNQDCGKCHKPTNQFFDSLTERKAHPKSGFHFEQSEKQFCVDCHRNVHTNQFDSNFSSRSCASCHTTQDFTHRLPFNHDESRFKLRAKHAELKCSLCHVPTKTPIMSASGGVSGHFQSKYLFHDLTSKSCNSCHKDPHSGKYGPQCVSCHRETSWKTTQDFHRFMTLKGVHNMLECAQCHRHEQHLAGLGENCKFCHEKDDIHLGTLPNCGKCHRQDFWENTEFKHSMSIFPLRGVHRTLNCNECHGNGIYQGTPSQCADCHRGQALAFPGPPNHTTLVNRNCAECHNQFSFR